MTLEDLLQTVLGAEMVEETNGVVDLQKMARKRRQKQSMLDKGKE